MQAVGSNEDESAKKPKKRKSTDDAPLEGEGENPSETATKGKPVKEPKSKARKPAASASQKNEEPHEESPKEPQGKAKAAPKPRGDNMKQERLENLKAVKVTKRVPPNMQKKQVQEAAEGVPAENGVDTTAEEVGTIMRSDTIEQVPSAEDTAEKVQARKNYKARKQRFYNSLKSHLV